MLLAVNDLACRLPPGLFSFQIYAEAKPLPTVEMLLEHAASTATQFLDRAPVND